jgi:hypothetical protein
METASRNENNMAGEHRMNPRMPLLGGGEAELEVGGGNCRAVYTFRVDAISARMAGRTAAPKTALLGGVIGYLLSSQGTGGNGP